MKLNIDLIYPIGSIYMSVNNTNPSSLFGGEWEAIAPGRCLMGAGTVQANTDNWCGTTSAGDWTAYAGNTGGRTRHTHNYGLQYGGYYRNVALEANSNAGVLKYDTAGNITISGGGDSIGGLTAPTNSSTSYTSTSMTHYRMIGNTSYDYNFPPYLVVYMWKRVS